MPTADSAGAGADAAETLAPRGAGLRLQAIANTAGNISFYAVVFLLTPLAIRELGSDGWGIWQLVGATTAYASLLALGLGSSIHYEVAHDLARGDIRRLADAFTCARAYLAAAAVVLLALVLVLGKPLMGSLVDDAHRDLAWAALLLTLVPTALTLPLRVYPSTLGGLQRLDLNGLIQMLSAVALLGATWIGFHAGMGLSGFAFVMTIGSLLPMLPAWFLAHRMLPRGCLRFTRVDPTLFRELIGYSLNTLAYGIGIVVLYQTMKFVAAWQCGGAAAAGEIGLAISIVQTLGVIFVPIFTALLSRFSQLHAGGQSEAMRALLTRALIIAGLLVVPSSVFLFADAQAIFSAWVGDELTREAIDQIVLATRLMLVGQGAYILALPCYFALIGIGQHRAFGIGMLVAATANALVGSAAAGFAPRIATLGWVFSAAMLALVFLVTLPVARRHFAFEWKDVFVRALIVPCAVCVPGVALLFCAPRVGSPIADLLIDAILFSVGTAPGLELSRRRLGVRYAF